MKTMDFLGNVLKKTELIFKNDAGDIVPRDEWKTGWVEFIRTGETNPVGIIEKDDVGWVGAVGALREFEWLHIQIEKGIFVWDI